MIVAKSYFFMKKSLKVTLKKIYVLITHEEVEPCFINRKMKKSSKKNVVLQRNEKDFGKKIIIISQYTEEVQNCRTASNARRVSVFFSSFFFFWGGGGVKHSGGQKIIMA